MERWFNIQSAISEGDWWGLDLPKSPRYAASARPCGSWVRKCRRTCPCISLRDRSARTTWSARAWKVPTITIIVAIHSFAFQPKTWKNWTNMGLFTKTPWSSWRILRDSGIKKNSIWLPHCWPRNQNTFNIPFPHWLLLLPHLSPSCNLPPATAPGRTAPLLWLQSREPWFKGSMPER